MSNILRPRFRYYVPVSQEEVSENFKAVYKTKGQKFTGTSLPYHITIDFPEPERHFWSPQIDLNLESYEEGTLIRGLLGPRPNVWTIFIFFNIIAGILGVSGIVIGGSQLSMNEFPMAGWLIPISILIFLAVFFIGKAGKRIAIDESIEIHQFLTEHLPDYIELEIEDL